MEAITLFRDGGGWYWALQDGEDVLSRSPMYPTRELALASAETARRAASDAAVRVDPTAEYD